ncbi:MAG: hypothetical protein WC935_00280 [Thermoleophilia bacterium]
MTLPDTKAKQTRPLTTLDPSMVKKFQADFASGNTRGMSQFALEAANKYAAKEAVNHQREQWAPPVEEDNPLLPRSQQEWNYKTEALGRNGEQLPQGAESWDPNGNPYFGSGVEGWAKKLVNDMRVAAAKIPSDTNPVMALVRAMGSAPGVFAKNILMPGVVAPAKVAERGVGSGRAIQEAAAGAPGELGGFGPAQGEVRSAPSGALGVPGGTRIDRVALPGQAQTGASWLENTANRAGNVAKDLVLTWNPVLAYNTIRLMLKPGTWREKADEHQLQSAASSIEYTAMMEPMIREEFIRRARAGENPDLLNLELQNPVVEAIGQAIVDPLNIIGMGHRAVAATEHGLDAAQMFTKVSDDVIPLIDDIRKVAEAGGDTAPLVAKLDALQVAIDATSTAKRAEQAAKGGFSGSLFRMTAQTRRNIAGDMMGELIGWISGSVNHPKNADEIVGVLEAMAKSASPNAVVRAEGLAHMLSAFKSPRPLLSQAGRDTAAMLYHVMAGKDGAIDGARFMEGLLEATKSTDPAAVALWAGRQLEPALAKSMPSMTDAIEAAQKVERLALEGKIVPDDLARLAAMAPKGAQRNILLADKLMQSKFYRPVNSVLSAMYMGYSPGYAMRNGIQNAVHILFDEGAGSLNDIFHPEQAFQRGVEWTGGFAGARSRQGITMAGGAVKPVEETTSWLRKLVDRPAQRLSQLFETNASKSIWGRSVERTMRKMLVPGRALPEIELLIKAGMSEDTARHLVNLVIENKGNVKAAAAALRESISTGSREAWKTLPDLLGAEDIKAWEQIGLRGALEDAIARSPSPAEAQVAVRDILEQYNKQAARVAFDHATITAEHAAAPESGLLGRLANSDARHAAIDDMMVGNENSVGEIQSSSERVLERAYEASRVDPALHQQVQQIVQKYRFLGRGEGSGWTAFKAARAERAAGIQSVLELTDNPRRVFSPDQLTEMWTKAGLQGPPPANLTRQTFRDAAFEVLQDESYIAHDGARDLLFQGYVDMNEELQAFGIVVDPEDLTRVTQSVEYARDMSRAAVLRGGKMYAWRATGLTDDIRTPSHLLLAINENLPEGVEQFSKLEDVPLDVAERALRNRAAVGGDMFKMVAANEASARSAGLRAVYNAPMEGDVGSSGWATDLYGEALTRARGDASKVRVRYVSEGDYAVGREAAITEDLARGQKIEEEAYKYTKFDAEAGWLPAGTPAPGAKSLRQVIPPLADGTAPTFARALHEGQPGTQDLIERTIASIGENGERRIPVISDPAAEDALRAWEKVADERVAEARLVADRVGVMDRDFALHNYGERYGFDHALGYIFPYHFWYTRTYANWLKRIVASPSIIANYARYRDTLAKEHSDMPEWWRYNISSDELLGIQTEHPLFFNLEQTLNPMNGLTGIDFNDPAKRVDWFTSMMDGLGKFGPSIWTPISVAIAVGLYNKDKEASARWAGRLVPQSALVSQTISKITGKPVELDPFTNLFSGGIDPYERGRVGRALGAMVEEDPQLEQMAIEAARTQTGPVWDAARMRAINERYPGQLSSFLFGAGFKMRTRSDMTIDQFYGDYNALWTMRPNMSPDKFRQSMDNLRKEYPFMDALLLAKKAGKERDATYAYNVLSRIPPGQSDDYVIWAGGSRDLVNKFYADKGDMSKWAETDRTRFNAAMIDIGAMVSLPDNATRAEWNKAKAANSQMYALMEQSWGKDIMGRVDAYYSIRDDDKTAANRMLAQDPNISQALDFKANYVQMTPILNAYYGSLGQIELYWKSMGLTRAQVAEKIVEFGTKINQGRAELTEALPASTGQESLVQGVEQGKPGLPMLSWQEWQGVMGENLANLVADYALNDDPLPKVAMDAIYDISKDMGLDKYVVLELAAQSVPR